jgi:chromosome transmission fidelity protein 18
LVTFETASVSATAPPPVRYAVRQVLDQEYQKSIIVRENAARQARYKAGNSQSEADFSFSAEKENKRPLTGDRTLDIKRDFFGRVVNDGMLPLQEIDGNAEGDWIKRSQDGKADKIWVSFHEGFSNAVRKPITVEELLRGL